VKDLKKIREAAGLSQFDLARRAGVSRMRLQLAEAEYAKLRADEIGAINRALRGVIEHKVTVLQKALSASGPFTAGV
jgi:transcriptional regulator with XRE-family HTH domain